MLRARDRQPPRGHELLRGTDPPPAGWACTHGEVAEAPVWLHGAERPLSARVLQRPTRSRHRARGPNPLLIFGRVRSPGAALLVRFFHLRPALWSRAVPRKLPMRTHQRAISVALFVTTRLEHSGLRVDRGEGVATFEPRFRGRDAQYLAAPTPHPRAAVDFETALAGGATLDGGDVWSE